MKRLLLVLVAVSGMLSATASPADETMYELHVHGLPSGYGPAMAAARAVERAGVEFFRVNLERSVILVRTPDGIAPDRTALDAALNAAGLRLVYITPRAS